MWQKTTGTFIVRMMTRVKAAALIISSKMAKRRVRASGRAKRTPRYAGDVEGMDRSGAETRASMPPKLPAVRRRSSEGAYMRVGARAAQALRAIAAFIWRGDADEGRGDSPHSTVRFYRSERGF